MSSVEQSPLVVANPVDAKVTRVFNFPHTLNENQKLQVLEPTIRGHSFSQRAAIGTSFDVSQSLVAQAIPENELFLSKMSIFRNRYIHFYTLCYDTNIDTIVVTQSYSEEPGNWLHWL